MLSMVPRPPCHHGATSSSVVWTRSRGAANSRVMRI
jgi:hypothetical protein